MAHAAELVLQAYNTLYAIPIGVVRDGTRVLLNLLDAPASELCSNRCETYVGSHNNLMPRVARQSTGHRHNGDVLAAVP